MNLTIKGKNLSVKIAWFLAVVAGILTKPGGDWLDFLFGLFGAVMGLYLISLLFAWILSFIINKVVNKEEEQKKTKNLSILDNDYSFSYVNPGNNTTMKKHIIKIIIVLTLLFIG